MQITTILGSITGYKSGFTPTENPQNGTFYLPVFIFSYQNSRSSALVVTQPAPKPFTSDKWPADISPPHWNNLLSYSYLQSLPRAQIMVLAAEKMQEQLESTGDFTFSTVCSLLSQPTQMCTWRCVLQCIKCEAWIVERNTRPQLAFLWRWRSVK